MNEDTRRLLQEALAKAEAEEIKVMPDDLTIITGHYSLAEIAKMPKDLMKARLKDVVSSLKSPRIDPPKEGDNA